jgi:hypothetical protein
MVIHQKLSNKFHLNDNIINMVNITKPKIISLKNNSDVNGNLISIEESVDIPILIKRIFYIYGSKDNLVRGKHANRNSDFFFISLAGSCKVKYYYDSKFHYVLLDKPTFGLFLPKMVWKDMYEFTNNSVLLVITNTPYDNKEYIKDFDIYLKEIER